MSEHARITRQIETLLSKQHNKKGSISLGNALAAWRESMGYTVNEMAKVAGVAKTTVSRHESAYWSYRAQVRYMWRALEATKCSVDDFIRFWEMG